MGGSFETSDSEKDNLLKPLRVPTRHADIYVAAKEMVDDLPGWKLVSEDEATGVLNCSREARLLGGRASITIRVEGPDDIPSTTLNIKSVSEGGMLSHDRKNVYEFMKLFFRRVC